VQSAGPFRAVAVAVAAEAPAEARERALVDAADPGAAHAEIPRRDGERHVVEVDALDDDALAGREREDGLAQRQRQEPARHPLLDVDQIELGREPTARLVADADAPMKRAARVLDAADPVEDGPARAAREEGTERGPRGIIAAERAEQAARADLHELGGLAIELAGELLGDFAEDVERDHHVASVVGAHTPFSKAAGSAVHLSFVKRRDQLLG
jgi:hypothetical protein